MVKEITKAATLEIEITSVIGYFVDVADGPHR